MVLYGTEVGCVCLRESLPRFVFRCIRPRFRGGNNSLSSTFEQVGMRVINGVLLHDYTQHSVNRGPQSVRPTDTPKASNIQGQPGIGN